MAAEMGDRVNAAYCLRGLAMADSTRAARLFGAADAALNAAGAPQYATADHEEGQVMTLEQAVEYALEGGRI